MVIQIIMSGGTPERLAEVFKNLGYDGTAQSSVGFTTEWGVEHSVTLTFGFTERDMDPAALHTTLKNQLIRDAALILGDFGQEAAVMITNGHWFEHIRAYGT